MVSVNQIAAQIKQTEMWKALKSETEDGDSIEVV
jgi:hypothetical protein